MIKPRKSELVFEVTEDINGGYAAECLTQSIATQGDDWDGLRANVRDAVQGYFYDGGMPDTIRLVRDDVLLTRSLFPFSNIRRRRLGSGSSWDSHAGPRWQPADFGVGCSTWRVWMR
jgi:hypothetical protein